MGEYEPEDSRNVTGTATTPDGRWTNKEGKPPAGVPDENPADAKDAATQRGHVASGRRSGQDRAEAPDRDAPTPRASQRG